MNRLSENLKENIVVYGELSEGEQACFDKVGIKNCEYRDNAGWLPCSGIGSFLSGDTYRIHKDYQPAPDTPVFPGYVLRRVRNGQYEEFPDGADSDWTNLSRAVNCGCVGGVFKEKGGVIMTSLCAFYSEKHDILLHSANDTQLREGFKPATLGWVVFKETD